MVVSVRSEGRPAFMGARLPEAGRDFQRDEARRGEARAKAAKGAKRRGDAGSLTVPCQAGKRLSCALQESPSRPWRPSRELALFPPCRKHRARQLVETSLNVPRRDTVELAVTNIQSNHNRTTTMNTKLKFLLALALTSVIALQSAVAAKKEAKPAKEQTITGEAKCAKCALKETDTCQTAVVTENKKGKAHTVYLEQNDVAKKFHETVCKETKKVSVTGTLKKGEDRKAKATFAATKIELVK
jgi:Family of unknown function (DUF6370)